VRSAGARGRAGQKLDNDERILAAARTIFLEHGYRVNLATVAEAAGVTRQSLYNRFHSKERLFEAVLKTSVERISLLEFQDGELTQAMYAFALEYRRAVLNPDSIGFAAIGIAERKEFPQLARSLYERASGEAMKRVSGYLRRQAEAGRIAKINYSRAAERFLGSVVGLSRVRAQSGMPAEDERWEDAYVREAVSAFLAGLAPHHTAESPATAPASTRERTAGKRSAKRPRHSAG
jgi:TetR/AcrR family transcriptional regulator, mexJK operon transcriptional repressor